MLGWYLNSSSFSSRPSQKFFCLAAKLIFVIRHSRAIHRSLFSAADGTSSFGNFFIRLNMCPFIRQFQKRSVFNTCKPSNSIIRVLAICHGSYLFVMSSAIAVDRFRRLRFYIHFAFWNKWIQLI